MVHDAVIHSGVVPPWLGLEQNPQWLLSVEAEDGRVVNRGDRVIDAETESQPDMSTTGSRLSAHIRFKRWITPSMKYCHNCDGDGCHTNDGIQWAPICHTCDGTGKLASSGCWQIYTCLLYTSPSPRDS